MFEIKSTYGTWHQAEPEKALNYLKCLMGGMTAANAKQKIKLVEKYHLRGCSYAELEAIVKMMNLYDVCIVSKTGAIISIYYSNMEKEKAVKACEDLKALDEKHGIINVDYVALPAVRRLAV